MKGLGVAQADLLPLGVWLLGFQTGGRVHQSELQRVRYEAAKAERQLHDLTRDAFIAIAEHVDSVNRER